MPIWRGVFFVVIELISRFERHDANAQKMRLELELSAFQPVTVKLDA